MRESHTLDGKTIFEWRAEYAEMAERFVEYADHHQHCIVSRVHHWHIHQEGWDKRTICAAAPCICGVLIILMLLAPEQQWIRPCPDEPVSIQIHTHTTRRTRPVLNEDGTQLHIFNIPVVIVEDDDSVPKTD